MVCRLVGCLTCLFSFLSGVYCCVVLVDLRIQLRAMRFDVDDCGRELVVGEGMLQYGILYARLHGCVGPACTPSAPWHDRHH